ncbi:MAG: hypothetical protein ABFS56_11990 [Pseudomonadota bacterium]
MKRFIILVVATSTLAAGGTHSQELTEGNTKVYRHGNSTATITQDGASSEITVERDANSQTIEQHSDNNSAVIKQSTGKHAAPQDTKKDSASSAVECDTNSQTIEQHAAPQDTKKDSASSAVECDTNSQTIEQHAAPQDTKKASKNRANYKTRGGIELRTSEKFRRLFLDRLDKSHFDN